MVPARALFCHQCSISVTLFCASPPSPLRVFESISGKPGLFLPKWLQYTFFTPKELPEVVSPSCADTTEQPKHMNRSCSRHVISSSGTGTRTRTSVPVNARARTGQPCPRGHSACPPIVTSNVPASDALADFLDSGLGVYRAVLQQEASGI